MSRFLLQRWYGRPGWLWLLWPLEVLYGWIVLFRRQLYLRAWRASRRLPVPVLVVGNISLGGTGKTPMVLALIEHLRAQGWTPGVISRGYGGRQSLPTAVDGQSDPAQVGDEPVLLARRSAVPLFIGRDRVAAAEQLLRRHPQVDVLISDDGLQHYRLARDLEIVLYDGQRGLGNGHLLPVGPLREAPRRVHACVKVWTTIDPDFIAPSGYVMRLQALPPRRVRDDGECALAAGSVVAAFAGIGHPQRFFSSLKTLGYALEEHPRPDHHVYTAADFAAIDKPVLMTEKDAVKCRTLAPEDSAYLPVTAALPLAFWQDVEQALKRG